MGKVEVLAIIAIFGVYLLAIGLGIANYVMESLSLYTIAKKRKIKNPALSWIPVASSWIIGCVTDELESDRGIDRKWRKILLTMSLVLVAMLVILYVAIISVVLIVTIMQSGYNTTAIAIFVCYYIALIIMMIVSVALGVLEYICRYKIFESIVPEKAVKYILLSVLVPLASAICLMKCKDKCPEQIIEIKGSVEKCIDMHK